MALKKLKSLKKTAVAAPTVQTVPIPPPLKCCEEAKRCFVTGLRAGFYKVLDKIVEIKVVPVRMMTINGGSRTWVAQQIAFQEGRFDPKCLPPAAAFVAPPGQRPAEAPSPKVSSLKKLKRR